MVWCFGAMWSSALGLTNFSLDESCAGGDDEGEWGEKCCTWCDVWDEDVGLDILFAFVLRIDSKISGSFWNVTCFFCFGLGSWKESTLSPLLRFFFFTLGGSWNDELSWHCGSVSPVFLSIWAFNDIRVSSFQYFSHCPCQPFQLHAILFLQKESNLLFHF